MKISIALLGWAMAFSIGRSTALQGEGQRIGRGHRKLGQDRNSGSNDNNDAGINDSRSPEQLLIDGGYASLLPGQCLICEPLVKRKPISITMMYIGGQGVISRFQDEEKATCRTQTFAESDSVSAYSTSYQVTTGSIITLNEGGNFDAETDFIFGNGVNCFIHTSCSQPIVSGDQIGPWLILAGNDCTYSFCGDGVVDAAAGEECDDGNTVDDDGCRNTCLPPICGDGILDAAEDCDEGDAMPSGTCRDCSTPSCGDGVLDSMMGEMCDDGNTIDGDGCRSDCTFCGDGIQDAMEDCDDGNADNADGCRNDCTVPRCGDGIQDAGEMCDDANADNDDGCRSDCTMPSCGDGIIGAGEECDDGAAMPTATCREGCVVPFCGDFIVDAGEECDDGAIQINEDGCRNDCTLPSCGDGITDAFAPYNEQCDEGTAMPSQTCRDCVMPFCGDGVVDSFLNEQCDDGNGSTGDGCENCMIVGDSLPPPPFCGNGVLDAGEACDFAINSVTACRDDCTIPFCGDGIVDPQLGEQCDDFMNGDDTDGCTDTCQSPQGCTCDATAVWDESTGAVTVNFNMCGEEPMDSDFVGIYPCDANTVVADEDWYDSTVCGSFQAACIDHSLDQPFQLGYTEGEVYVSDFYTWLSFTCGSPENIGCQHSDNEDTVVWPPSGTVTIDPNIDGADWAFLRVDESERFLTPGTCYKVVLNREQNFISAPPYPTICSTWLEASEFWTTSDGLPPSGSASTSTQASPLEFSEGETVTLRASGSRGFSLSCTAIFLSALAFYWF